MVVNEFYIICPATGIKAVIFKLAAPYSHGTIGLKMRLNIAKIFQASDKAA